MFFNDGIKTSSIINGDTRVVGIFGDPVNHSFSPPMHNTAFRAKGLNYCYLPFVVCKDELPTAIKAIISLNIRGVNITAPHKEAAVPFLNELSPEVKFLKAVNTIVNREGKLAGYNTDVDGFLYLLYKNFGDSLRAAKVLLMGAGGAAKAVSLALARVKIKSLIIANRTPGRAERLATLLIEGSYFKDSQVETINLDKLSSKKNISGFTWIVNALSGDPFGLGLISLKHLQGCKAIIDLRYGLWQTPFEKWAEAEGIPFINGLDMLLGQGVKAFEIFTGEKAPMRVMEEALRNIPVNNHKNKLK